MVDRPVRPDGVPRRAVNLLLTAVIGIAVIGFFVGIDYGVPRPDSEPPLPTITVETEAGPTVLPAMSYADIRAARVGPTRQAEHTPGNFAPDPHDLFAMITLDPQAKRESLALRSQRRAYNGAPPIIPHSADQLSNDSCLVCHAAGFRLENRTAKQLPHPYLANCMQCHAPPTPDLFEPGVLAENTFEGVAAPFEGARAWTGAPPVIPHTTWMRDNCLACHGPAGWPGMETTHPWRQNCMQCHAPSAELNLHPPTMHESEFLPPPPVLNDE